MSNLKYKSSNSTNTTNTSTQPIWCSLSSPSQIARKYASIAPIWCHISRPRQLKKKFASTFHQAQNLLTRTHSKDPNLSSSTRNLNTSTNNNTNNNTNSSNNSNAEADDSDEMSQRLNATDTDILNSNTNYNKNAWSNGLDQTLGVAGGDSFNDTHRSSLRKRDSSLDIKRKTEKLAANDLSIAPSTNSYLYNNNTNSCNRLDLIILREKRNPSFLCLRL